MRTIIPFFCNLAEQITQFVAYRFFLLLQLNAAILSLEADERRGVGICDLPFFLHSPCNSLPEFKTFSMLIKPILTKDGTATPTISMVRRSRVVSS